VKTSNPVLSRLGQAAQRERSTGYGAYGPAGYVDQGQPYPTAAGYPTSAPAVRPMTIDDVVVKTVVLLGITGISAIVAWNVIPDSLSGLAWGGAAVVGCYAQEFPVAESTLGYGQSRSFGTITCDSEYTGMTCTDSSTGHYFRVSRETYELG